ncbi:MAG: PIG-L family deacetylase, partial [Chloroflexi bacterium]|nr:PIG-L family deacetylase [Chloroflexota bacterium]
LSCGGMLLRHAERSERATVLTICAGTPDYAHLSSFARVQHRQWGNPSEPIATRRAEDEAAIRQLGAAAAYLDIPDVIYRRDARGRPVVYSLRSLFGKVHPDEHAVAQRIAREVLKHIPRRSETTILGPLAAGRHVDHQLVREAAQLLHSIHYPVTWYEDFPYAEQAGAVTRARKAFGAVPWSSTTYPIDVECKVAAIALYKSQLKSTFTGQGDMTARVRAYNRVLGEGIGCAERVWRIET